MKFSKFLGLAAIVAVASAAVPPDQDNGCFKKVADFVAKTTTKATGAVGDFVEDAAGAVGDFADDAVDAVGDFAEDAADTVGDAVKKGAKAVAKGTVSAVDCVGDAVDPVGDFASRRFR
ncbi:hypothetical protein PoB_002056100 [Plakobranchus ocellatus]|uniref:Uncharacterized protein n=1 Tax=Plakobranchus ocellatus TaxID=259542 RepID=A0AAV3Z422_9GAST|nr:hypothetical protein PoB_002056100 [Plakobranchus ocellatus]